MESFGDVADRILQELKMLILLQVITILEFTPVTGG